MTPSQDTDRRPLQAMFERVPDRYDRINRLFTFRLDERWDGWNAWFAQAGLAEPAPVSGINFSDPGILLDSALAGHGVALASLTLAADALNSGALVQPFPETVKTGKAWYLVGEPRRIQRPAAQNFWNWLIAECEPANHEQN